MVYFFILNDSQLSVCMDTDVLMYNIYTFIKLGLPRAVHSIFPGVRRGPSDASIQGKRLVMLLNTATVHSLGGHGSYLWSNLGLMPKATTLKSHRSSTLTASSRATICGTEAVRLTSLTLILGRRLN